jgi:hypothetical protein
MRGVLHVVGSSHLGVVTRLNAVVLRIAQGVFDRSPQFAASNGISCLVGHAGDRQCKNNRNQTHNQNFHDGMSPRTGALY